MKTKYIQSRHILVPSLWKTAMLKPRPGETPWEAKDRARRRRIARNYILGIAGEILTALGLVASGYIMAVIILGY